MSEQRIGVGLGARSYDIVIGENVLDSAGALLRPLLDRPRTVIVSDDNVIAAQGARLHAALKKEGVAFETIAVAPGEASKSFTTLQSLLDRLIDLEIDRRDLIVAFGGGVIGDLAGFAAAILRRGCRFAQIPTSLLAQVDSAVGGKTGINVRQGKNLIGAFHQPEIVLSDIAVLKTLPPRELLAGYAEIVKYSALGDAAFFAWLETNGAALIAGDAAARIHAIKRSCEMKAAIVAADERETGARALLNLGHTFGHALETGLGYSGALLHGEAVAAGLGLAFDFSARLGVCAPGEAGRIKSHLKGAGLPAGIGDIPAAAALSAETLLALMRQDKKVAAGALTLILARAIGEAYILKDAPADAVLSYLAEKTSLNER
jgi:3-dehydroquinate synthase